MRRHGFTLVEVMLALTVLGIVATTVYGTFARTLGSKARVEEQNEVTRLGRSALGRIADDLAAAFYPGSDPARDTDGTIFRSLPGGDEERPRDSFAVSALTARPAGTAVADTDQRLIEYSFAESRMRLASREREPLPDDVVDFFAAFREPDALPPDVEPERLLRRETVMIGAEPADAGRAVVFLDNVVSLRLRFHNGVDWLDEWDSEDRAFLRRLPRAVEIELNLYDARGMVHQFTTAVTVPLADPRPGRQPADDQQPPAQSAS